MIICEYRASYEKCKTFSIHIHNPVKERIPGFKKANAWWHLKNAIMKEREVEPLKYKIVGHDPANPMVQAIVTALLLFVQGYDPTADKEDRIDITWLSSSRGKKSSPTRNRPKDDPEAAAELAGAQG